MLRDIKGPGGPDQRPFCPAALYLPSAMASALRCACAFALVCLVLPALPLLQPKAAVGEELQVRQRLRPRAANWLPNFGQFNKYLEKLFSSSVKSKNAKNSNDAKNPKNTPPANTTKPPPANATKLPPTRHHEPPAPERRETPTTSLLPGL